MKLGMPTLIEFNTLEQNVKLCHDLRLDFIELNMNLPICMPESLVIEIEIEEFNNAITYFPNEEEFAKFLSDIPGNPDYTLPELRKELETKVNESIINQRLGIKEHKYIWRAIKS